MKSKYFLLTLLLSVGFGFALTENLSAQKRDHLTDKEIDIIRDIQELDLREKVYVKAIDRRFLVLNNDASQANQVEKDLDKWGELRQGTRVELISDIEKILDEAMDKIEDVAERDPKNDLIPYAVNDLADGAKRFIPELQSLAEKTSDDREKAVIGEAIENCRKILEVAPNYPRPKKKPKRETVN